MKTAKRAVKIPKGSALAAVVRRGKEGVCLACKQPIREHFGHKNAWVGCQDDGITADTPFLLVPARKRIEQQAVKKLFANIRDGELASVARVIRVSTPRVGKDVLYVADRRIKATKFESDRLREVLRIVKARKHGIGRRDLITKLRASKRTGIVDGALRRLVVAGAIHSKAVAATA
jgi:hypothetical protein